MESFYKGIDSRIRLKCPICETYYHDKDNKEFIEEYGECLVCDKLRGNIKEEECYTDLGTQYVNSIQL